MSTLFTWRMASAKCNWCQCLMNPYPYWLLLQTLGMGELWAPCPIIHCRRMVSDEHLFPLRVCCYYEKYDWLYRWGYNYIAMLTQLQLLWKLINYDATINSRWPLNADHQPLTTKCQPPTANCQLLTRVPTTKLLAELSQVAKVANWHKSNLRPRQLQATSNHLVTGPLEGARNYGKGVPHQVWWNLLGTMQGSSTPSMMEFYTKYCNGKVIWMNHNIMPSSSWPVW